MPFQITIQTLRRSQGEITFFTAGPDQVVICAEIITLEAVIQGDPAGNTFLWEQIGGTPIVLQNADTLIATFTNNDLSEKIFRFYINKNQPNEVFDDITIYPSPISECFLSDVKTNDVKIQNSAPPDCDSIVSSVSVIPPLPNAEIDGQLPTTNDIIYTWNLQDNSNVISENIVGIEDIYTPDIHYQAVGINDSIVFDRRTKTNGTVNGDVTTTSGGFQDMFVFNGGFIEMQPPFFEPSLTKFTFSFLIQPAAVHDGGQTGTILSLSEDLIVSTPKFIVTTSSGNVNVTIRTDLGNETTVSTTGQELLNSASLLPVVIVYEELSLTDKNIKIYTNSGIILNQTLSLSGTVSQMQNARIGTNQTSTDNYFGNIDQIRFYDEILSELSIKRILNEQNVFIEPDRFVGATKPSSLYIGENLQGNQIIDREGRVDASLTGDVLIVPAHNNFGFDFPGDAISSLQCDGVCLGSTNEFTFSCYISLTDVSNNKTILTVGDTIDPANNPLSDGINLSVNLQNVAINIFKNGSTVSDVTVNNPLTAGLYYHIALSFIVGGNYTVYLNGTSILTGTMPGNNTSISIPLCRVGSGDVLGTPQPFNGIIDEIRFYNKQLQQADIETLANKQLDTFKFIKSVLPTDPQEFRGSFPFSNLVATENPISYWKMDEQTGAILNDYTSLNDGTIQGSPTLDASGLTSDNISIQFDGVTDYVTTTESYNLIHQTGIFTIQVWFQLNDPRADKLNAICGTCFNDPNLDVGFALYCDNRSSEGSPFAVRFLLATGDSNFVTLIANGSARSTLPTKVTVVGDGVTLKLYVNNILMDEQTLPILPVGINATHPFDIANVYDCTNSQYVTNALFDGKLSDISIFDVPLDYQTVDKMYLSGRYNVLNRVVIKSVYQWIKDKESSISCIKDFSEVNLPTAIYGDEIYYQNYPLDVDGFQTTTTRYQNSILLETEDFDFSKAILNNEVDFQQTIRYDNKVLQNIDPVSGLPSGSFSITQQRFTPGSL